jgi:lipopolysaccharide/colanic/teichoic acid biosynthesis glycosyltransferase
MRSSKLDELPQVWNIIRNEISLVGPRPCLPIQTQLIDERRERGVLAVKPGITGLAQVNGIDMSDPARLAKCDARYVRLQSLLLDIRLIISTALGRGNGDRVG